MTKIFISYSSKNREAVSVLEKHLATLGYQPWYDKELTGGHVWWNSILQAIRDCELFIFALSRDSLASVPCREEHRYAAALNKTILPVLIADNVSASQLPVELSKIHFVDYRQRDADAAINLARALGNLPEPQPLPDPLPPQPPVPLSPVNQIRERVDSSAHMTFEEQAALLFQLKGLLEEESAERSAIIETLQQMKRRDDLLAKIGYEIDQLLEKQGNVSATKTERVRPQRQAPSQTPKAAPKPNTSLPAPAVDGSILGPAWDLILPITLVWGLGVLVLYLLFTYTTLDFFFLWAVQGLVTARLLRDNSVEYALVEWFTSAVYGGPLSVLQLRRRYGPQPMSFYIWWVVGLIVVGVGGLFILNLLFLPVFDELYWQTGSYFLGQAMFIVLAGSWIGISIGYLLGVFRRLAVRRVGGLTPEVSQPPRYS